MNEIYGMYVNILEFSFVRTNFFFSHIYLFFMNAYFCPHLMFNSGYLIEFVCLNIDVIEISYNWVY